MNNSSLKSEIKHINSLAKNKKNKKEIIKIYQYPSDIEYLDHNHQVWKYESSYHNRLYMGDEELHILFEGNKVKEVLGVWK